MSNKKKIIKGTLGIAAGLLATGYALKKTDDYLDEQAKTERLERLQLLAIENTKYATLKHLDFIELDTKIASKDSFVAYFAWTESCIDARHFELNSFDKFLKNDKLADEIYVIDLDKYIPSALANKDERDPYVKRFLLDTWTKDEVFNPMLLRSPILVYYSDGKIKNLLAETSANHDSFTGINEWYLEGFFAEVKSDLNIK